MIKAIESFLFKNINRIREKLVGDFVRKEISNGLEPVMSKLDEIFAAGERARQDNAKSFSEIENKFVLSDERTSKRFDLVDQSLVKLYNIVAENRRGMGTGLERLCGKWLERFLFESKTTHTPVIFKHKLVDTYGIVHGIAKAQVEVDVFIDSPRIIIECTTFVNAAELIKLKKFAKTKELAASQSPDGQCRAYLAVYAIDPYIRSDALTILKDSGIVLIEADELKSNQ